MSKTFQELDLSNAILFAAALEDPETCQLVLEIILGKKISKVNVRAEHSVIVSSDFKSVRLDIYATDELQVNYNLEAQNANRGNLTKRTRLYQAEMDVSALKPGMDYEDLKPSYVIFICTFDPFGKELYRYTFSRRCEERNLDVSDETYHIFLSTKGTNDDEVPIELVHFLKYMEHSTDEYVSETQDVSIKKLHDKITELKKWRQLEERYMTGEEWIQEREWVAKEAGKAEGKAEGKTEGMSLIVTKILEKRGFISKELSEKIAKEMNQDILSKWAILASEATNLEEFMSKM